MPFDIATKTPQKKTEANMCMPVSAAVKHKLDTRPHVTHILAKQVILNTVMQENDWNKTARPKRYYR